MMLPGFLGEDLFDDWMNFPFGNDFWSGKHPFCTKSGHPVMKTDIRDKGEHYELDVDLPGYKKEDIRAQLKDGCLTVSAVKNETGGTQDEKGNYIRRERYTGSMSRSFYVGNAVQEEDIHAKFEDGILKLSVPKQEQRPSENKGLIAIEG